MSVVPEREDGTRVERVRLSADALLIEVPVLIGRNELYVPLHATLGLLGHEARPGKEGEPLRIRPMSPSQRVDSLLAFIQSPTAVPGREIWTAILSKVTDSRGNGLSGVRVYAVDLHRSNLEQRVATTDQDGYYFLPHAPAGRWRVVFSHAAYQPAVRVETLPSAT